MDDSFLLYVLMFGGIASIFGARVMRQKRRHSAKQLSEFRAWKSGDAEAQLKSKIGKLQERLKAMERRREEDDAMMRIEEYRDMRGRQIYGDAWHDPEAGEGAPIRDLLALSEAEVEFLQRQAKALFEHQKKTSAVDTVRALSRSSRRVVPELLVVDNVKDEEEATTSSFARHSIETTTTKKQQQQGTDDRRRISSRVVPVVAEQEQAHSTTPSRF